MRIVIRISNQPPVVIYLLWNWSLDLKKQYSSKSRKNLLHLEGQVADFNERQRLRPILSVSVDTMQSLPHPARQNGDFGRNFTYFPLIFRWWYPIRRFSAHMFTDSSYFHLFPPFFHLKWYPILVMNSKHGTPSAIFHFSTHMFTEFRLFSA